MGYTLRASITAGRIDSDSLGSFEIRDGELEAEDYATAAALVDQYNVQWPNGDPGPEDADVDAAGEGEDENGLEEDDGPDDSDDSEEFNAQSFVDRTPMREVTDDIESGDYDDHLDAIEDAAKRQGVQRAVEDRRGD